ncbi:MAG: DUF302 domain-containing protein [Aquincola sp.]|nr:DUF302 domain-containing protein [Aquincola sp.]MDH4289297.1 DUF302 domain-containing protein [Aquincola sp.]MDH5331963.1 DUF302 domain-containing protein [Aquincola sp.]
MNRLSSHTLFVTLCIAAFGALAQPVVTYSKSGASFSDVRDDLKAAIEARGLVIDYQAQIGRMLERTGADVGSTKPLFADAQTMQFCSAKLSRKTMEADPANVVMCPYSIVVYATAAKPDQVFVAYRRPMRPGGGPASRAALAEVDTLLNSIAREAVGRK